MNLNNNENLWEFNSACIEACCTCPQYDIYDPMEYPDRNVTSPHDIAYFWLINGDNTLTDAGYKVELDDEMLAVFEDIVYHAKSDSFIQMETGNRLSKELREILIFN